MIEIEHIHTKVKEKIERYEWERNGGKYSVVRDQWKILDEGDPVVLVSVGQGRSPQEQGIYDREHAIRIVQQKLDKYKIIELSEAKLKPAIPINKKNSNRKRDKAKVTDSANPSTVSIDAPELRTALSKSKNDEKLIQEGYYNQGLIGYMSPIKSDNLLSLKQVRLLGNFNEYFYFTNIKDETVSSDLIEDTPLLIGYIPTIKEDRKIRLHRFYNHKNQKHFYCTNPNIERLNTYGYEQESGGDFSQTALFSSTNENRTGLYVYSTRPEIMFFDPIEEKAIEYSNDAEIIPDGIAQEDLLNRKALMEVIHKKIKVYWNDKSQKAPFTLLINGPWGSGKSSMLFYLKELLTKDDNWNVIDYNAWKNQRFENPWWILVNKISKEIPRDLTGKARSHWYWKNISQNAISYRVALVFALVLIIGFTNNWLGQPETLSFIGSVIALVGSAWFAIQGVIKHLFKKHAMHQAQAENANDPLQMYTDRFEEVVQDKKVAIFIDDLDRCEVRPTVKLLEGVQTLFKGSKVLYVMAADGQWLVNCFDKKYKDFEEITSDGQTIGNQFLQKTFQLVVDVPKINKEQIANLLNTYVGNKDSSGPKVRLNLENAEPFFGIDDVKMAKSPEAIRSMTGSTNISAETRKVASERLEELIEEDSDELEHYILEFQKTNDLPLNPRQLKRIINLYTMKSQEFAISGVRSDITQEMILNYVIFSTEYPKYKNELNYMSSEAFTDKRPEIAELLKPLKTDDIKSYF